MIEQLIKKNTNIILNKGDSLHVTYTNKLGEQVLSEVISPDENMEIDTFIVAKFTEEFGFENGLAFVLGKENREVV